ncbi:hypothetical protein [Reinekea thalattae]|uniref:Uncharacterized protein n=1 Tax=Reinekea thalattae TaxID=2593301 RepID=A0A5C8Z711_9GAMM|nr:hypothetical protein [Reinekea thalattae]TXR53885.1 hypothetical protein FME95_04850 [Reinekea thalattae]
MAPVLKGSNKFTLELPANADDLALPLNNPDLKIEPSDTKLMRLATFHIYPERDNSIGGGGFINNTDKNNIILLYFSQAATLSGAVSSSSEVYLYDIKATSPGWHWINIEEQTEGVYLLQTYKDSIEDIEFTALVAE